MRKIRVNNTTSGCFCGPVSLYGLLHNRVLMECGLGVVSWFLAENGFWIRVFCVCVYAFVFYSVQLGKFFAAEQKL